MKYKKRQFLGACSVILWN